MCSESRKKPFLCCIGLHEWGPWESVRSFTRKKKRKSDSGCLQERKCIRGCGKTKEHNGHVLEGNYITGYQGSGKYGMPIFVSEGTTRCKFCSYEYSETVTH